MSADSSTLHPPGLGGPLIGTPWISNPWIVFLALLGASAILGLILQYFFGRALRRVFSKFPDEKERGYPGRFSRLFFLCALCAGIAVGKEFLSLPPALELHINQALACVVIAGAAIGISDFLVITLRDKIGRGPLSLPTTTLTGNLVNIAVLSVAALMIFSILGISIAPLLTALGVGSLAVALGLHDTLANFFAGIYILRSRIFTIGDYIKIEGGPEGFVTDVSLSAVSLKTFSNTMVYAPTTKVAQGIVTNLSNPTPEIWASVEVRIGYDSEPGKAGTIALEVAKEVASKYGSTAKPPGVQFTSFSDWGMTLSASLLAENIGQKAVLIDQFIKAIYDRFQKEGIRIAVPRQEARLQPSKAPDQGI